MKGEAELPDNDNPLRFPGIQPVMHTFPEIPIGPIETVTCTVPSEIPEGPFNSKLSSN